MEALRTLTNTCRWPESVACPALILLDLNMMVMNGQAFLEAYQQQLVVVVLTTSMNAAELARV